MSTTHDPTVCPEFDPRSKTYHVRHDTDWSSKVSTTLVLSISSLSGDDPTQMHPLHGAVDPDSLERLLQDRDRGADVSFDFHGYHVSVRADGRITLDPLEEIER